MADNKKKRIVILSTNKVIFGFATVTIIADDQDMAWIERLAKEEIPVLLSDPDLTTVPPDGNINPPDRPETDEPLNK